MTEEDQAPDKDRRLTTTEKVVAVGSLLLVSMSIVTAFLAIKPEGVEVRLAFCTIVTLLAVNAIVSLGRYVE